MDPTPQRQCAWLLSTYLKEGEEQKEVLEAKDDEERSKRESLHVRMRHGYDDRMNEAQTRALELLSHSVMCKESNEDDTKETLQNKQRALTSLQLVYSCVFTCFRFASTLNMLLCLFLRIRVIISVIVNVPRY